LTVGFFNSGKIGGRRILSRKSPSWRICRKRNSKENASKENAKISQVFTVQVQVMCGKGKRVENKRKSRLRYNNSKIKT